MREIYVTNDTKHITIGKTSENDALKVYFPKEGFINDFGEGGNFMLLIKRPGENETPYFADTDESTEGYVAWIVNNADVAREGYGACELHYIKDDITAKSITYHTLVNPALGEAGDAPDPADSWLTEFYDTVQDVWDAVAIAPQILEYANTAEQAAENANAAAQAAQAAQVVCEDIAVVGGYTRTQMDTMLAGKQDLLTFDDAPTEASENPVKSGGVYGAIEAAKTVIDNALDNSSTNPVQNAVITDALAGKQPTLVFDNVPTVNSDNPVYSGGVYSSLANVSDAANAAIGNLASEVSNAFDDLTANVSAALANKSDTGHTHDAANITSGTLPISRGGTGLTAAPSAQVNLASEAAANVFTSNPAPGVTGLLPIAHGGTGANTAAAARAALGAQAALAFDATPTSGSSNPVTSNGIYAAIQNAGGGTIDTAMSSSSTNAVQNKVITAALANKSDTGHTHDAANIASGTLAVGRGGTGVTSNPSMLVNLASTAAASVFAASPRPGVTGLLPVANGGTGANTAAGALSAIGAAALSHTHGAGDITSGTLGTARGGTGVTSNPSMLVNLASTTAASVFAASPRPGITGTLGIGNGGTGNTVGYIRTGLTGTAGNCATAEGYNCAASGNFSHAEGYNCTASGNYSHAEGRNCVASGGDSHAEGVNCTASGGESHAEGSLCKASNTYAHAEGYNCSAAGTYSHAEGRNCAASGASAHAEGDNCAASGSYSHAGGFASKASGTCSFASGDACAAVNYAFAVGASSNAAAFYQAVVGEYNTVYANSSGANASAYFMVGKGTASSARANAFRVASTAVYGAGAYNSSGADYAELFEWQDGNPNAEDRAGMFVTLDGDKIKLVATNSDFILGIVSGNPSVCGDVFDDQWAGMYEVDVFGRPLWEDVDVPTEYDDDGNEIMPAHVETRQKLNPNYDNTIKYKARTERPEWDAVGILGKLVARDDGTCIVNGWAKVSPESIATYSETQTKYRVMERIDDSHIRVLIL